MSVEHPTIPFEQVLSEPQERRVRAIVREVRMTPGLTALQSRVLDFIRGSITNLGKSPSVEEICAGVDLISRGHVLKVLDALEERGFITKLPRRHRTIRLTEQQTCPHCGHTFPAPPHRSAP